MGEWHHPPHYTGRAGEFARSAQAAQIAVFVECVLPHLRDVARGYGYALAVHGSQARDLDLIAIPWIDKAKPWAALVAGLAEATKLCTGWGNWNGKVEDKPQGRKAVTITASFSFELDLSVMPCIAEPPAEAADNG